MEKISLCGIMVTEEIRDAALRTWPHRPPTGYDDRSWGAACANHVLLVSQELSTSPQLSAGGCGPATTAMAR